MKFINWERRGNFNKRILELVWLQCIWDDYVCKIMCVFQEMYYVLENDKAQLKANAIQTYWQYKSKQYKGKFNNRSRKSSIL